jgi:hypothetical protein
MLTLVKLVQHAPESSREHTPVATIPSERPKSPVDADGNEHVQLDVVPNQASDASDSQAVIHHEGPRSTHCHRPEPEVEVTVKVWCPINPHNRRACSEGCLLFDENFLL